MEAWRAGSCSIMALAVVVDRASLTAVVAPRRGVVPGERRWGRIGSARITGAVPADVSDCAGGRDA